MDNTKLAKITYIAACNAEEAFAKLIYKLKTYGGFDVSVDKESYSLSFKTQANRDEKKHKKSAVIDAVLYQVKEESNLFVAELIFA